MLPASEHYYDDQTYETYRQQYSHPSTVNYPPPPPPQQQNEQQLFQLSLG
jgi:hypothetical protein